MKWDVDLRGPWRAILRAPMVRMATPFMVGVLLAAWRDPPLFATVTAIAVMTPMVGLILLLPSMRFSRWQRGLVLSLWFLSLGLCWQVLRDPVNDRNHFSHFEEREGPWALRITAVNGTSGKVLRADAEVLCLIREGGTVIRTGSLMMTLMHKPDGPIPRIGDRVLVDAPLEPIARVPDPGGFDRKAWAASRGMDHELFAPPDRWRHVDHVPHWTGIFTTSRERIATWLAGSALETRERALVKALVLGQRDELDGEQRTAFARSGTIHVLAVSGMHVGLIFAMLSFLFGWWGGGTRARYLRGLMILLALWCYAGLTGASPSVLRATIMFSLFTLANMAAQRTDHLNSLFAAAFLLLLWEPRMLGQVSFQLSFLAVLGIIVFYKPFESLWSPESKILRGIWALAVVSLSAQMLTTPVSLHLFKAFPVWFLPANIIVVTIVGLAVNGSVALLLLYKVPVVGAIITWVLSLMLKTIGVVTEFVSELPGAYPEVRVDMLGVVLLYVLILAIAAWWQWNWRGMHWVAGIATALLLVVWAGRARSAHERSSFVVYDARSSTMGSMTSGRHFLVWSNEPGVMNDPASKRKLEVHQRAVGLHAPIHVAPGTTDAPQIVGPTVHAGGMWRSPAISVAFHSGKAPAASWAVRAPGDALVLHDLDRINDDVLDALVQPGRTLVLGTGISWRTRYKIRDHCAQHAVPLHDIAEDGAFVISR